MAQTTVFVDDAVRGRLPLVCAKSGVPTGDRLRVSQAIGNRAGLGIAWLLILAGPLGWIGLLVIFLSRSGRVEELDIELPYAEPVYQRMRSVRSQNRVAFLTLLVSPVVGLFTLPYASSSNAPVAGLLAVASVAGFGLAVIGVIVTEHRLSRFRVGITLDASRRWVRLDGVHPTFAAACDAQERDRIDLPR
jgi:hypothetical protein